MRMTLNALVIALSVGAFSTAAWAGCAGHTVSAETKTSQEVASVKGALTGTQTAEQGQSEKN